MKKESIINKIDWDKTAKLLEEIEKFLEEMEKNESTRKI